MAIIGLDREQTSNGAEEAIAYQRPYVATVRVEGSAPLLFHRWNNESVEAKGGAAKGSKAKKTDDVESYVWRIGGGKDGELAVPGEYFRQAIIAAAKFRQDPRSPRKSAMDLFKAGVVVLDDLCGLGVTKWDYLDKRRVTVMRAGITRVRPAMEKGWACTLTLSILTPEYISPMDLNETIQQAGRLVGVGDFRPSYGRFAVVGYQTS